MTSLPQYITKGEEIIENQNEINNIINYFNQNYGILPEEVSKYNETFDDGIKTIYCRRNTEAYYLNEYNFYEEYILSNQELEFELKVKNTRALTDIASSLAFFHIIALVGLIITGVLIILFSISIF